MKTQIQDKLGAPVCSSLGRHFWGKNTQVQNQVILINTLIHATTG